MDFGLALLGALPLRMQEKKRFPLPTEKIKQHSTLLNHFNPFIETEAGKKVQAFPPSLIFLILKVLNTHSKAALLMDPLPSLRASQMLPLATHPRVEIV